MPINFVTLVAQNASQNMNFQVVSDYQPKGDQPQAIKN
jgi:hypothetical protein